MATDTNDEHQRRPKSVSEEKTLLDIAPMAISIESYVGSRAREVIHMMKEYKKVTSNKNPWQDLPRHMRRRASSYNIKRLPRRVRQQALANMVGSGAPSKTKRPSRKHRRKPSNLLTEYVRRQRKCVWLETHLWHAKRYHMTERWGYKIPLHLNDKSARASYRALNNFCIMQDISYWCCIELRGPQQTIVRALNKMTSKEVGSSVEAAVSLSGAREGTLMLYEMDSYPVGAIGPVRFLWCPERKNGKLLSVSEIKEDPELPRKIWLWVHPSCHDKVLHQLQIAMGMSGVMNCSKDRTSDVKLVAGDTCEQETDLDVLPNETLNHSDEKGVKRKAVTRGNEMKSKKRKSEQYAVPDPRTVTLPVVAHYTQEGKEIISLKDNLVRFRLTGLLTNTVLTDLLVPSITESKSEGCDKWWCDYFAKEENRLLHKEQSEIFQQIRKVSSPGSLTSGCVLGLTVRDPRLLLPKSKILVEQEVTREVPEICRRWPADACSSPLWEMDIRNEVKTSKATDASLNKFRSQQLVPGTDLNLGDEESRVPVILIQRPGCQPTASMVKESLDAGTRHSPGWGSGWDLVLPAGWAMPFWVGLVYRGARTCGVREEEQLCQEMGLLSYPRDFPDTMPCAEQEKSVQIEKEAKYNRMPPAKRPNFAKLGTAAPFHYPWRQLLKDWDSCYQTDQQFGVLRNRKLLQLFHKICSPQKQEETRSNALTDLSIQPNVLVAVQITDLFRGRPQDFSIICLPSKEDMQTLEENITYGGPMEQLHKDAGKKSDEKSKKKKKRVIKFPADNIRKSCDREVIGYVNHGGFYLSVGKGSGMGFVAANGLLTLIKQSAYKNQIIVLIRTPNSLKYRFAYLTINLTN